jgi:hypothetical protein
VIVIVAGTIGRFPVGGNAWVHMQYVAGLGALGHEVFYLEDAGPQSWVYDWERQELRTDLEYPASYVRDSLAPLGLDGRWIYRAGERAMGMGIGEFAEVCAEAELLVVHGVPMTLWRDEYTRPRRRIFVDVDPGFTHFELMKGERLLTETVDRCDELFTIGQRLGKPDCPISTGGRRWWKTRAPVSLDHWPETQGSERTHRTCVVQWRGFRDVDYDGVVYGQKDREFPRFVDLPGRTPQPFRIALTGAPAEVLERHGWEVVSGWAASLTPAAYQSFIQGSRGEFSVAKHGYVRSRVGWFSDRSVCYLASGLPVLVQDTGLSDWLPVGEGIVTFRDPDEALRGIEVINADYRRHQRAARRLAETCFSAEEILASLVGLATA